MDALDLTQRPPRSPMQKLAGLYMLARTIDKVRALLPGGNIGSYKIAGFSRRLLDALRVQEEAFRQVVASAESDDEVVAWLRERGDLSEPDGRNAEMLRLTIGNYGQHNPGFFERHPLSRNLSEDTPMLRMLELDDAETFAPTSRSIGS